MKIIILAHVFFAIVHGLAVVTSEAASLSTASLYSSESVPESNARWGGGPSPRGRGHFDEAQNDGTRLEVSNHIIAARGSGPSPRGAGHIVESQDGGAASEASIMS